MTGRRWAPPRAQPPAARQQRELELERAHVHSPAADALASRGQCQLAAPADAASERHRVFALARPAADAAALEAGLDLAVAGLDAFCVVVQERSVGQRQRRGDGEQHGAGKLT